MDVNYAEICWVGNLEADFQQVWLVQFFLNFHNIVLKHQYFKFSKEKKKNIFLDKNSKKSLYYRNCTGQTNFGHKFNFMVNIWEQNTETEKTNGFW